MKIIWIGDMHLRLSDLLDADSIVDQLLGIIKSEQPELVVLAGDQFDSFAVVRSEILAVWTRFFTTLSNSNVRLMALVGNHDMAGADGGVSAMEPFKNYPHVTIVDKQTVIIPPGDEYEIHFLPFMRSSSEFEATLRKTPPGSFVFGHQSVNGAQFENGFYDPHGADPLAAAHLNALISGHVHKEQQVENIWYPGTPRQLTFSDAGERKSVYTVSLSKSGYTVEKRHVLDLPLFHVVNTDTVPELLNQVRFTLKAASDLQRDLLKDNIKLVAKGTPSEIAQFWNEPEVIELKSKARRVVDALTSMKPLTAFIAVAGQTQSEKLNEYIKGRTWRTSSDQLAKRARECLIT